MDRPLITPGSYRFSPRGIEICGQNVPCFEIVSDSDLCWIALVQDHRSCINTPSGPAMARLFCAAPDLLEALKLMVSPIEHLDGCLFKERRDMPCQCRFNDRMHEAVALARAAIAKAERLYFYGSMVEDVGYGGDK